MGCIGGGGLTPNIDTLAEEGLLFERAFSNGPGTSQSFPAILSSTYFLMHGGMRLQPGTTTLAEALGRLGLRTAAFHSNPFLSKGLGWGRGFSEYHDFMEVLRDPSAFVARQQERGLTRRIMSLASRISGASRSAAVQRLLKRVYYKFHRLAIPYIEGAELNRAVIGWIEANRHEKFFLWMHYMDPHYPFIPPDEYLSDFSDRREAFDYNLSVDINNPSKKDVNTLRNLYGGEVRYTDACIGELLQYLRENNLYDESLIALAGDHGHAFMEHGRFGHSYDILYNEVIHVPLIIAGLGGGRRIDIGAQLLDLPPTITDALGSERTTSFMGRSLLRPDREPTTIFSESARPDLINLRFDTSKKVISCLHNNFKLILNEILRTVELYDVSKDFHEKNNRLEMEDERRSEFMSMIKNHITLEETFKLNLTSKDAEIKIRERLKTLGYI